MVNSLSLQPKLKVKKMIMEKQIAILLKELEKATYGDDNSKHNNRPNVFTFKKLVQQIFKVGYSLYGSKDDIPKQNAQLFYDLERKLMLELEVLCQKHNISDEQLISELEPKLISLYSFLKK